MTTDMRNGGLGTSTDIGGPLHDSFTFDRKHTTEIYATDRQHSRTVLRASYSVLPILIFFLSLVLFFSAVQSILNICH
jgi:hypothetical protein